MEEDQNLAQFVKDQRKKHKMSQEDLARMAGVGLRFVRDLEQGKKSIQLDKLNQVLSAFGHEMVPKRIKRLWENS
ncbi:helix-turn-helix transcriptional regulator [Leptospira ilyithenensis]|uniref:Transcriptional regulator n=1 Tax=Leptospira ilyithenensis TaxID=2484901 RepID=A0A4R9LVQ6_9LEPT|nr:helix-turn-helix transcriptional regulator [Leptospira ilyithenensis]TGN14680.1 transcriptional regulator [Leptospira ilyithenensis]